MTSIPRQKPRTPGTNSGINGLIAACNKNDRFKLLEDDDVLPGNLDNTIHTVFSQLDCQGPMRQALHLASHFLAHDTLLSFFVPLLYGRASTCVISGTRKTYLSNPLTHISTEKHQEFLLGVRSALEDLSHSLSFHFQPPAQRVYARTLLVSKPPAKHTSRDNELSSQSGKCTKLLSHRYFSKIELADHFQRYYTSGKYTAASRCGQFRHDFLFATTLVHEIVHALGVVQRGNLNEPYIRADCPETEWGYGWEHFMFGCVINPQDRSKPGTHLLMRKVWAEHTLIDEAGGKEYSDVPMSYVAQWFRKETWDILCEQGPTAVAPPAAHFKIQSSNKLGAWVVQSDHPKIKKDLRKLYSKWRGHDKASSPPTKRSSVRASKIIWKLVTTEQLQKSNVPTPARAPRSLQYCLSCFGYGQSAGCKHLQKVISCSNEDTTSENTSSYGFCPSLKRYAESMKECSRSE